MTDVQSVRDRGASEFGVEATPTFFINGSKYSGALNVEEMSAIIDGML
jgi:protein-disulfide isomerase